MCRTMHLQSLVASGNKEALLSFLMLQRSSISSELLIPEFWSHEQILFPILDIYSS